MCNEETEQEMTDRVKKIEINRSIENSTNKLEEVRKINKMKPLLSKIDEIKQNHLEDRKQIKEQLKEFAGVITWAERYWLILATAQDDTTAIIIETMLQLRTTVKRKDT